MKPENKVATNLMLAPELKSWGSEYAKTDPTRFPRGSLSELVEYLLFLEKSGKVPHEPDALEQLRKQKIQEAQKLAARTKASEAKRA